MQQVDANWIASRVSAARSDDIAGALTRLIASGQLAAGVRLPTVRDLARRMAISPSTVTVAWQRLRVGGLIETHRRGGTIVLPSTALPASASGPGGSRTYRRSFADWSTIDFSRGIADASLRPDLGRALAAGLDVNDLHDAEKEGLVDALIDAVAPTWPYAPQAWATAGGGTEGMLLALQAATQAGDRVAIENPSSPRLIHVLSTLGLIPVPVACDAEGPLPDSLSAALKLGVSAFLYQLRAHVPTGHAVSAARREQLADRLEAYADVVILEDDHIGTVTNAAANSIGARLPGRSLLVRAYCRAFGIDLRMSVIGGSTMLIDRIEAYRKNRVAMTSRIFQGALAFLLTDPEAIAALDVARARYASRRQTLVTALRSHGFQIIEGAGLIVWVPVPDESKAIVNLATQGVVVGSGAPCFVGSPQTPHIRISISQLPDEPGAGRQLADMVAAAVIGARREEFD